MRDVLPRDPRDVERAPLELGLCLSGGGYRAMLFHAGVLSHLADSGALASVQRVSSVSGGSIAAGRLAVAWPRLVAAGFSRAAMEAEVVAPLRAQARVLIDVPAALWNALPFTEATPVVRFGLQKTLQGKRLGELPTTPRFDFLATNLMSGKLFRFAGSKARDYRVGEMDAAHVPLSVAVAASAAFPPLLAPVTLPLSNVRPFERGSDLHRPPYTERAVLGDGGIYDNQGMEPVFDRCRRMIVSDGGSPFAALERPSSFWPLLLLRSLFIMDSQVHALRRRLSLRGAVTTESTLITIDGGPPDAADQARAMAAVGTQLRPLPPAIIEALVEWGRRCAAFAAQETSAPVA